VPYGLAFGLDGTLFVSQGFSGSVVTVDTATGDVAEFFISPIVIEDEEPVFLAIDTEGDLWIQPTRYLYQVAPDATVKPYLIEGVEASGLGPPGVEWHTGSGIAFDAQGRLWMPAYNSRVWRLDPVEPGNESAGFVIEQVVPGFEAQDIAVGPTGDLFVTEWNTAQLLRIEEGAAPEVVVDHGFEGSVGVAVADDGAVYLGLPYGEIVRVEDDATMTHYADLLSTRMVFGTDGALYAVVGDIDDPNPAKSIVRITDVDTHTVFATEIAGISLGDGEVHISPSTDQGLYVYIERERSLFFVDYSGQGNLINDFHRFGGIDEAVMAASPTTDDAFLVIHGSYRVLKISSDGTVDLVAIPVPGDPWGMVVSPDGNWLYLAESGVIDKIPIG